MPSDQRHYCCWAALGWYMQVSVFWEQGTKEDTCECRGGCCQRDQESSVFAAGVPVHARMSPCPCGTVVPGLFSAENRDLSAWDRSQDPLCGICPLEMLKIQLQDPGGWGGTREAQRDIQSVSWCCVMNPFSAGTHCLQQTLCASVGALQAYPTEPTGGHRDAGSR